MTLALLAVGAAGCTSGGTAGDTDATADPAAGDPAAGESTSSASAGLTGVKFDVHRDPG